MARATTVDTKQLDALLDSARDHRDAMENVMREIESLLGVDVDDMYERLDYSAKDLVDYVATEIGEEHDHQG